MRDEIDTSSACEADVVRGARAQPPASPPQLEQPPEKATLAPSQAASADRTPPTATLRVRGRHTGSALLSRGLTFSIGCSEPCGAQVSLTAPNVATRLRRRARISTRTVLAAGRLTTAAARARALTIRPTRAGRRALPMLAGASLKLVVIVSDRAENRRRVVRRLRLANERRHRTDAGSPVAPSHAVGGLGAEHLP